MDFPALPDTTSVQRGARHPLALWLVAALVGFAIGGAALASSGAADSRDFASHGPLLGVRAL